MSPRFWRILGVAVALVVVAAGWFALVSPARSDARELRVQTEMQEQQTQQLRSRISLLQKQNEEIPAQQAILASVQRKMPSSGSVPALIRSLSAAATKAGVTMSALVPERPVEIEVTQERPTAPTEESDDVAAEPAGDAGDAASDADADAPAQASVQRLPLTITVCGSFAQLRKYLGNLEGLKRVMTVDRLSITRGACEGSDDESDLTATMGSSVFILPAGDVVATGDAASGAPGADSNGAN
jgi:Tfp pilus assembly protein PilO